MTDKAPPAGWVVQVTIAAPPTQPRADGSRWLGAEAASAPSFRYFDAAIANPDKAVEATAKRLAKAEANAVEMRVVRPLSPAEIAAAGLQAGEVKPA